MQSGCKAVLVNAICHVYLAQQVIVTSIYRVSQPTRRLIEEGPGEVANGSSSPSYAGEGSGKEKAFSQDELAEHFSEGLQLQSIRHVRSYPADNYRLTLVGTGEAPRDLHF